MKHSFLNAAILVVLSVFVTACGSELDKQYESEKQKRESAEQTNDALRFEVDRLRVMLKNFVRTERYIWAWVTNGGSSSLSYDDGRTVCQGIGFDFPTEEMLSEADANKELFTNTTSQGGGPLYYVLGKPESKGFVLMCAKASAN